MALTDDNNQLLKSIYQRLDDHPLKPGDPLYQPVYEDNTELDDPVDLMQRHIEFSDVESMQMFSGFRGSGKTTELLRLKGRLKEAGYVVLYADALEYVNPSEPVEIADLLVVLAGAFSDALEKMLRADPARESYWTRLKNYLTNTEVGVGGAGVSPEIAAGLKAGLDLKLELRTTPSFRQKIQQFLANRIGELKGQVDRFVEDGVKAIRSARGEDRRVVFLFDSLEQLRGSLSNEQPVIRSVERLFANHLRMLRLPYVHVIYTVPPWLQFVMPGITKIVMIPSIRQWNNDTERSEYPAGWQALRGLLRKRVGHEACERLFGAPDTQEHYPLADKLIAVCGGHFRDLLLLLREAVLRAQSQDSPPMTEGAIEAAVRSVRGNFLPIAIDDAEWLDQIARTRAAALPSAKPEDANRLTRFLDTHFVLYLTNGEEWYDIHPLIRQEVVEILRRHADSSAASQTP